MAPMIILISIFVLAVLALTLAEFRQNRQAQLWLKPLAALLFILIAVFGGAIYWDYGKWILAALMACAIGDVFLLSRNSPVKFQLGMAAFAIGHLLYVFAFVSMTKSAGLNFWGILPAIAAAAYLYWVWGKLPKDMKIPVLIYTAIIVAMVLRSFDMPIWYVPLAAIMFSISDMFVARDRFVKEEPLNALAITPLYFGAQGLFALSAGV